MCECSCFFLLLNQETLLDLSELRLFDSKKIKLILLKLLILLSLPLEPNGCQVLHGTFFFKKKNLHSHKNMNLSLQNRQTDRQKEKQINIMWNKSIGRNQPNQTSKIMKATGLQWEITIEWEVLSVCASASASSKERDDETKSTWRSGRQWDLRKVCFSNKLFLIVLLFFSSHCKTLKLLFAPLFLFYAGN